MKTVFSIPRGDALELRAPFLLDGVESAHADWTPAFIAWPEAEDQTGTAFLNLTDGDGISDLDANAWMVEIEIPSDAAIGRYDAKFTATKVGKTRTLQEVIIQVTA